MFDLVSVLILETSGILPVTLLIAVEINKMTVK